MIGKHFLVYNQKNKKAKRHYTICNCLLPHAYNEYMRVMNEFDKNNSSTLLFDDKIIDEKSTNMIPLTIKNY